MLRAGESRPILSISAVVWQDWATLTEGTWRQQPALSGGGFLFDTGAHMLNTVSDLAGEDFADVAAWRGRWPPGRHPGRHHGPARVGGAGDDERHRQRDPVVPLGHPRVHVEGDPAPGSGASDSSCSARIVATPQGQLGRADADLGPVPQRAGGHDQNLSPPEVGLRMARLWDAIRESTERGGAVIRLPETAMAPSPGLAEAAGS